MRAPKDCESKEQIRDAIDTLDRQILELFGKRFEYVKEIIRFKTEDKSSIKAQKRYDEVIKKRGEWAAENGMSSELFEKMYTMLLDYFIEEETKLIQNK